MTATMDKPAASGAPMGEVPTFEVRLKIRRYQPAYAEPAHYGEVVEQGPSTWQ